MHTLLIVDDEEIEREGMAQFIPWDTYKMKVVGTARNGAEGLEKIAKYKPDLAIVDIKMPVMNGIEMIRKAKEQYPDMTFVVLSGYGDYEFTSQAMELGVRHYILKPCDEGKMIPVLNKAIAELEETRAQNARSEKVEAEARLLKPYAREQLFRDLLQGRALPQGSGTRQLLDELGGEERSVLLLDFRLKCGFDSLERYVIGNMLGDLLPDGTLLMTTGIDRDVLVLADAAAEPSLESAVQVLKKEFKRFETVNMLSAASRTGTLEELATLFQQVQELLQLNPDENETALLRPSQNAALPETVNEIFDIRALQQAGSYEELLRELALAFARMEAKNYRPRQRTQLCELAWKLLFEGKTPPEDGTGGLGGCPDRRVEPAAAGCPQPRDLSGDLRKPLRPGFQFADHRAAAAVHERGSFAAHLLPDDRRAVFGLSGARPHHAGAATFGISAGHEDQPLGRAGGLPAGRTVFFQGVP